MRGAGREKSDEPGVVVQRFERRDDQPTPRQRAAKRGGRNRAPVPALIHAVDEIQILESQFAPANQPVIGDQHAGYRPEAARVPQQPREDVARRIGEQLPRLNQDTENPGDQSAGLEADEARKRVGEIVRRRHDVGGDVDGDGRDDDGEHRDGDDHRRAELADELHRIPDRFAVDDRGRAGDHHSHRGEQRHRRRQRHDLTNDLLALAAPKAREVGHVERQRRPESDHRRQRRHEDGPELRERLKLSGMREQRAEPVGPRDRPPQEHAGHDQHERRGPVLDMAQQIHAAIDDGDVEPPEQQERQPSRGCVPAEARAKQRPPPRNDRREERIERFAADPRLNAEPAARDEGAHQRRDIRAQHAVGRAREHGERDAVLRPGMRVQQDRHEDDRVAQQNRDQRLRPVHARRHQARGEHVGRNAMRHADPQRCVVVGGPVPSRDRDRREVLVVDGAGLDALRADQLHAAIRKSALVGHVPIVCNRRSCTSA
jgi:hypothetical protein